MPQRVHTAPRPSSPPGATEHAARTLGASVGPTRGHLAPRSAPFAPSRAHLAPLLAAGSLGLQRAAGLAPGCALRRPPLGHGWRAQHTQRLDHHQRRDQPAAAATQAQRRARTQLREEPAAARGLMLRLGASSAVGRLLAPRAPRVVHALPPDLAWGELRLSRGCVRARGGGLLSWARRAGKLFIKPVKGPRARACTYWNIHRARARACACLAAACSRCVRPPPTTTTKLPRAAGARRRHRPWRGGRSSSLTPATVCHTSASPALPPPTCAPGDRRCRARPAYAGSHPHTQPPCRPARSRHEGGSEKKAPAAVCVLLARPLRCGLVAAASRVRRPLPWARLTRGWVWVGGQQP